MKIYSTLIKSKLFLTTSIYFMFLGWPVDNDI